jgi:type I site-specific restriction-modification system R (restriction) subunit
MSRNWRLFAQDIEEACRKICRYMQGLDQEKDIRKRFRKPDEQPKILIVTEKR